MSSLSNFVKRLRDIMRNDAGINGDAQRIEQIAWLLFLKVYDTKEEDWEFDDDAYESIIPEECRWRNWAVDNGKGTALTGDDLLDFVNNTLFPTLKGIQVSKTTPINKAIVKTTFEDTNNYMKDGVLLRQVVNVIDELDLTNYEESHAFGDIYESILKELQSAGSAGEFYTPRAVTDFMAQMIKPVIGEKMAEELAERNYNIDLCGFPHEEEEILPPRELIQQYQEKRASLNADIDRILEQITGILGISDMEDLT